MDKTVIDNQLVANYNIDRSMDNLVGIYLTITGLLSIHTNPYFYQLN